MRTLVRCVRNCSAFRGVLRRLFFQIKSCLIFLYRIVRFRLLGGGGGLGSWSFPVTRNRPLRGSANAGERLTHQAEDRVVNCDILPHRAGGGGAPSEGRNATFSWSNPARPGREQS